MLCNRQISTHTATVIGARIEVRRFAHRRSLFSSVQGEHEGCTPSCPCPCLGYCVQQFVPVFRTVAVSAFFRLRRNRRLSVRGFFPDHLCCLQTPQLFNGHGWEDRRPATFSRLLQPKEFLKLMAPLPDIIQPCGPLHQEQPSTFSVAISPGSLTRPTTCGAST